jgi:hypothetical protein
MACSLCKMLKKCLMNRIKLMEARITKDYSTIFPQVPSIQASHLCTRPPRLPEREHLLTIWHQFQHQCWVGIVTAASFRATVFHTFRRDDTGHLIWEDTWTWFQWAGLNQSRIHNHWTKTRYNMEHACLEIVYWTLSLL